MTANEYNGPYYQYGLRIGLLIALVPVLGLASAGGALAFLLEQRGKPETTPIPARARGDIVVALIAHTVYALSIVPLGMIP